MSVLCVLNNVCTVCVYCVCILYILWMCIPHSSNVLDGSLECSCSPLYRMCVYVSSSHIESKETDFQL